MSYSLLRVARDAAAYYQRPFIVSLWLVWLARRKESVRARRSSGA